MTHISTGYKDLGYHQPGDPSIPASADVATAHPGDVSVVLAADPHHGDGRSQWVWMRFPNGDLVLATFPQGETYFDVEAGVSDSFEEAWRDDASPP